MKDLAPDIVRQRMVIEGTLENPFSGEEMTSYCEKITKVLDMTPVTSPMCNYDSRYGWCAYMHWKESGIHIYSWEARKPPFFSIDIYTCKVFNELSVIGFTRWFFGKNLKELTHHK
jgi:S-adenosylmethionine decarboxylase